MTFAEALNTLAKDVNNKDLMDRIIESASWTPWAYDLLPQSFKDYAQNFWKATLDSQDRLDATAEEKKGKISQTEQMIETKTDIKKEEPKITTGQVKTWTWLTQNVLTQLDTQISKIGKAQTFNALKTLLNTWKINKSQYDKMLSYINTK
jgi:hypothetical protein